MKLVEKLQMSKKELMEEGPIRIVAFGDSRRYSPQSH